MSRQPQRKNSTSFPHPRAPLRDFPYYENEILLLDTKTQVLFICDDSASYDFVESYPNPNNLILIEKKEVLTGVSEECRN